MLLEEAIELPEAASRQADLGAMTLDQPPSAVAADREADVVAQDRAGRRAGDHPRQRQTAELRQRRPGQQRRFARDRQAGVFKEYTEEDDGIAVARKQIEQPLRHGSMLEASCAERPATRSAKVL